MNVALQNRLEDPANKAEVEALKKAHVDSDEEKHKRESERDARALKMIRQDSLDVPERPKQVMTLLNLLHVPIDSMLYRLATVLARIEDLAHVLVWTSSKVTDVDQDVNISKVELPRLKLSLQPKVYVDTQGNESVRLYSLDHAGLFVSDYRSPAIVNIMSGLDYSLCK
jgi:hypothetical protein